MKAVRECQPLMIAGDRGAGLLTMCGGGPEAATAAQPSAVASHARGEHVGGMALPAHGLRVVSTGTLQRAVSACQPLLNAGERGAGLFTICGGGPGAATAPCWRSSTLRKSCEAASTKQSRLAGGAHRACAMDAPAEYLSDPSHVPIPREFHELFSS